jgi:hypothetical protein
MRIRKKSGELQEFDRRKLEESIRRAGASQDVAKRIAERIQTSEGMSTQDIRRRVADELRAENMALSGAYMSVRRLRARSASDLSTGVARLHTDHLRGLSSDRNAMLVHGSNRAELRVEPSASAASHEVLLSSADLQRLGIQEGSRVAVRFPL